MTPVRVPVPVTRNTRNRNVLRVERTTGVPVQIQSAEPADATDGRPPRDSR